MPNALLAQIGRLTPLAQRARGAGTFLRREIVGLAQDFWKDGDGRIPMANDDRGNDGGAGFSRTTTSQASAPIDMTRLWHAQPGEISEKMWGPGCVTPCDHYLSETLIRPLAMNKDMSLLDLSAGLGMRLRKTAEEYKVYITGLEPDPEIAARGMAMSKAMGLGKKAAIEHYDPAHLKISRKFDCVVARETLYRAPDTPKFIATIVDCCKPKAQVSFTDYIVNSEARDQAAIAAWRAFETGANPMGLVEMAEAWAKAGISLRMHEDLTDMYKKEVKAGLVRFVAFITSGVKPDAQTKKAIEKRIMTWAHRMAALEQGMKFYRFYGVR
jgi:cyclopropane fatty-acyl-phospholipid synthase-like methyltransferase